MKYSVSYCDESGCHCIYYKYIKSAESKFSALLKQAYNGKGIESIFLTDTLFDLVLLRYDIYRGITILPGKSVDTLSKYINLAYMDEELAAAIGL